MEYSDRNVRNSFEAMLDLDRDGLLDTSEQAMQFDFFDRMSKEDSCDSEEDDEYGEIIYEIDGMDREEGSEYLEREGCDSDDFE